MSSIHNINFDENGKRRKCTRERCQGRARNRGLCQTHYRAHIRNNPIVPVADVVDYLHELRDAGMTWAAMERASGVNCRSIQRAVVGTQTWFRPETADALLNVPIPPPPSPVVAVPEPAPMMRMPIVGTQRRLRALVAVGYTNVQLAAATGYNYAHLPDLINARQPLTYEWTRAAVADAFNRLEVLPAGNAIGNRRARIRAARHGWPPPLAWDPDTIDDPAAQPEAAWRRVEGFGEDWIDEVRDQLSRGRTAADIAHHFGVLVQSFERRLERCCTSLTAIASQMEVAS